MKISKGGRGFLTGLAPCRWLGGSFVLARSRIHGDLQCSGLFGEWTASRQLRRIRDQDHLSESIISPTMSRPMTLTLYSYILRELVKVLVVSTAALVVVMSFAAAIKPLNDGLLGPLQLLRFIGYSVPGMLHFALPFGAVFSSTLVFYRMSTDNEITACAACGISYSRLLVPVVLLGMLLSGTMLFMSNWVLPSFWKRVSAIVEKDIARVVTQRIQDGDTVKLGQLILYADSARDVPVREDLVPAGQLVPYNSLELQGVAVGKIERKTGLVESDSTAERAIVNLYRTAASTFATIQLNKVAVHQADSGYLVTVDEQPINRLEIPRPMQDKPEFMSLDQLRELARDVDSASNVRRMREKLAKAIAVQQTVEYLHDKLTSEENDGRLVLFTPSEGYYQIRSPRVTRVGDRIHLATDRTTPISVGLERRSSAIDANEFEAWQLHQQLDAMSGTIEVSVSDLDAEPRIHIQLREVTITDSKLRRPNQLKAVPLSLLRLRDPMLQPLLELSSVELLALKDERLYDSQSIRRFTRGLKHQINRVVKDVHSRVHERASMAVSSMMVLVLGGVMAMLLRLQTPLIIFFWCFLPTSLAVLMVPSGQNVMTSNDVSEFIGIAVTWSGNLILMALVTLIYRRLSVN